MDKKIEEMTVTEIKAALYDCILISEKSKYQMNLLNAELSNREKNV